MSVERRERNAKKRTREEGRGVSYAVLGEYIFSGAQVLKRHCSVISASVLPLLPCMPCFLSPLPSSSPHIVLPKSYPVRFVLSLPIPPTLFPMYGRIQSGLPSQTLSRVVIKPFFVCAIDRSPHAFFQQNRVFTQNCVVYFFHSCQ